MTLLRTALVAGCGDRAANQASAARIILVGGGVIVGSAAHIEGVILSQDSITLATGA